VITIGFVTAMIMGLMLAEARLSRLNEAALRESGALRPPGDVYAAMAILYPAAFLLMGIEGAWRASSEVPASGGPAWAASGAVLFIGGKALKYWAMRTLGPRWSFRVWVTPGSPLVRSGPYQYLSHPNYVGVGGELVGTAMMMGARLAGPLMILLFGLVLWARIRFEERVLAAAAPTSTTGGMDGASYERER
jgi:methyltransferase